MSCPSCGRENREGATFCDECGAPLADACPQCGATNRPGAKFCDSCGLQLGAATPVDVKSHTPAHLAEKILSVRREMEGERRTVTVLFADTRGFTPLSEAHDAEQMYGLTQACIERMLACVHRHEGTVNQFTGDGIMAIFGAPIAHEDSARRGVAAALDMQRELKEYVAGEARWQDSPIAFRVGLNTGPVVVGRISDDLSMDYTAVGDTVNLAARMEQMCEPGSVYLTDVTYRQVADYFDFEDVGPTDVKGKAEPVHIYKAVGEKAVRTRLDAAIARGLSPFTGRGRELDTLKAFWNDALSGSGQIVLVSGEPGIGKSRLLLEFRRSLPEDVIWREAQCVPYGEGIPYLPVVDLVRSGFGIGESDDEGSIIEKVDADTVDWTPEGQKTVPYLKFLLQVDPGDAAVENMDPMERRAGILDALRALILERSRVAPRVVVVEDLHWADDQSEEAFRVVADVVASSRVLMILTFRPGYLHPSGDLPNAHRVVLNDLDADARRQLASATLEAAHLSADFAGPVTNKAEGNPLFIEEVAKALAAGAADVGAVPDSLQDVILARIDRLETSARGALQLASVIGREFTLRLLNRISDLHAELEGVLTELKTLELIYEKAFFPELAYMFKHALTHDVAYSTLLVERRNALHQVVAGAIEELYADRIAEHYETLAHHYTQSEQWEKALDYLEKSGDKAAASFANEEALRFYAAAIEICERLGGDHVERPASIEWKRSPIALRMGRFAEAIEGFDRIGRIARDSGDPYGEGMAWGFHSFANFFDHNLAESDETATKALEVAGDNVDVRFMALWMRAYNLLFNDHFAEYKATYDELVDIAPNVEHPGLRGMWGWGYPVIVHWAGHYDQSLEVNEALTADRESSGDATAITWGRWIEGLALGHRGEYERAIEKLASVITDAERIGDLLIMFRALNSIGWVYGELQDLESAIEWNKRSFDSAVAAGFPDPEIECNAALNLGDNYMALGRLDDAEEQYTWVERIYRDPKPADRFMLWRYSQHMLHSYGELWLRRGDLGKAQSYADECLDRAEATDSPKNVVKARRLRAQILLDEGKLDEAEREVRTALEVATQIGNPGQLWKTWTALGGVLSAAGRDDEARAAYREAKGVTDAVAAGLTDPGLRETFLQSDETRNIAANAG